VLTSESTASDSNEEEGEEGEEEERAQEEREDEEEQLEERISCLSILETPVLGPRGDTAPVPPLLPDTYAEYKRQLRAEERADENGYKMRRYLGAAAVLDIPGATPPTKQFRRNGEMRGKADGFNQRRPEPKTTCAVCAVM